ncbi:uncharacterized protein [Argopecten irradians]|uniref:uncharacterized protein n=1 Tax=Argopecten irradians TaxID=31199 RepID=UPI003721277F
MEHHTYDCILQVGADQFVVPKCVVRKVFGTKIDMFLDVTSGTHRKYVIRRPKDSTMALIEYCYTGNLHIPKSVCKGEFLAEMRFWGLKYKLLESCCYHKLRAFLNDQRMLKGFETMYTESEYISNRHSGNGNTKERIWGIVNCDRKSTCSKVYFYVSTTIVLLMIIALALTSLKNVHTMGEAELNSTSEYNNSVSSNSVSSNSVSSNSSYDHSASQTSKSQCDSHTSAIIKVLCEKCSRRGISASKNRKKINVQNTNLNLFIPKCCYPEITLSVVSEDSATKPPIENKDNHNPYDLAKPPKPQNMDHARDTYQMNVTQEYSVTNVTSTSASGQILRDSDSPDTEQTSSHSSNNSLKNTSYDKFPLKDTGIATIVTNTVSNSKDKLSSITSLWNMGGNTEVEYIIYHYMEYVIELFFAVEFVLRLITCPNKKDFISSCLNWLDMLLFIDSFCRILLDLRRDVMDTMSLVYDLLLYLQMLRICRLFRTIQNVKAFKILRFSLITGMKDIFVLVMYVMVTMCIFSNFIYFVESKSDFQSIPATWWWSVVTMTTVGYGDMVPKTVLGKLIGCICTLSGVVLFSLIIPVFVTTFHTAYEYAKECRVDDELISELRLLNVNPDKQIKKLAVKRMRNPNGNMNRKAGAECIETTQI